MKITNKLKILLISILTILSIGFLESVQFPNPSPKKQALAAPVRPTAIAKPTPPIALKPKMAGKPIRPDMGAGKNKRSKHSKKAGGSGSKSKNPTKMLNSNNTNNINGTCYKKKNTNSTNVIGKFRKQELIYKFPFLLDSCDQVLLVKGFVIQLDNYFNATPVYMTISAYMLNLFEKENPDNLLKSVSLNQLVGFPVAIAGAPQCAAFKAINEQINFCFKSVKIMNNVMTSVKQLFGCRKGIPINNIDCLTKIDFTVKGPFGKIGPKLKQQIELARLQMQTSKLVKSEKASAKVSSTLNKKTLSKKILVNTKYYNMKVPGS